MANVEFDTSAAIDKLTIKENKYEICMYSLRICS